MIITTLFKIILLIFFNVIFYNFFTINYVSSAAFMPYLAIINVFFIFWLVIPPLSSSPFKIN